VRDNGLGIRAKRTKLHVSFKAVLIDSAQRPAHKLRDVGVNRHALRISTTISHRVAPISRHPTRRSSASKSVATAGKRRDSKVSSRYASNRNTRCTEFAQRSSFEQQLKAVSLQPGSRSRPQSDAQFL
jgi:hypothetical protein